MKRAIISIIIIISGMAISVIQAENLKATVTIDNSTTYQTVRGFGGFAFAATWGNNLSDSEIAKMFGKGANQLGYNLMRARISPEEYASWGSDNWGATASVIKKCRDLGCIVFASAWTPPAAYKSNGEHSHGSLLPSHYEDYAIFLNRFIDRMVSCGTDVDYISLQNEPDFNPDYEGCVWSAKQFIDYYRNYAKLIKRPLIGPESLAFRREMCDSILNDSLACANLPLLGGHLYGGGNFDYKLAREKGREYWMTEYLIDKGDDETSDYNWQDALLFARVVNTSMLANYSAWCHYALKSSYGMMGDGTRGTTAGEATKRGYVLSHFAKYTTGSTRVKHTLRDDERGLTLSAYQSPEGDSIILMAINRTNKGYDLTIDLPFVSKGAQRILTRQSSNMTKSSLNYELTSTPTLLVTASSIATFIIKKSGERTTPQNEVEQPVFNDNFACFDGECVVPLGWKITYNGNIYEGSMKPYSFWGGNPKLFYYSPESQIAAGIQLVSTSSKTGQAVYGSTSGYKLYLEPDDYRLIYHAIGWEGAQKISTYFRKEGTITNIVFRNNLAVDNNIGGLWGTQNDIFNATADTLNFTVTQAGNYLLTFKLPYTSWLAKNGSCIALVGGIKIEKESSNETALHSIANSSDSSVIQREYYNLSGVKCSPDISGIYIERSILSDGICTTKKVFIK